MIFTKRPVRRILGVSWGCGPRSHALHITPPSFPVFIRQRGLRTPLLEGAEYSGANIGGSPLSWSFAPQRRNTSCPVTMKFLRLIFSTIVSAAVVINANDTKTTPHAQDKEQHPLASRVIDCADAEAIASGIWQMPAHLRGNLRVLGPVHCEAPTVRKEEAAHFWADFACLPFMAAPDHE